MHRLVSSFARRCYLLLFSLLSGSFCVSLMAHGSEHAHGHSCCHHTAGGAPSPYLLWLSVAVTVAIASWLLSASNKKDHSCDGEHGSHEHAHGSLREELLCHFPYSLFAVVLSLVLLAMMGYGQADAAQAPALYDLFHTLHFLHILFAASGTVIALSRYTDSLVNKLFFGTVIPAVFCTLSDTIMPYIGGVAAGITMQFHWCFASHTSTIGLFLGFGVLNGLIMGQHAAGRTLFAAHATHFMHIFISAFASTVYLVSQGFFSWAHHIDFVFSYLILAVLIPCTFADLVVPTWFGRLSARK